MMTRFTSHHGQAGPVAWMADAACRHDDIPTWMFFPAHDDIRTLRAAVAVCASCPVIDACADYARQTCPDGIWASRSWDTHTNKSACDRVRNEEAS